jgi:hypothetical protein
MLGEDEIKDQRSKTEISKTLTKELLKELDPMDKDNPLFSKGRKSSKVSDLVVVF